jgi:hypothetical protein
MLPSVSLAPCPHPHRLSPSLRLPTPPLYLSSPARLLRRQQRVPPCQARWFSQPEPKPSDELKAILNVGVAILTLGLGFATFSYMEMKDFRGEIMGEISSIRGEISSFRGEINSRFDRIDAKLDVVPELQGEVKALSGSVHNLEQAALSKRAR